DAALPRARIQSCPDTATAQPLDHALDQAEVDATNELRVGRCDAVERAVPKTHNVSVVIGLGSEAIEHAAERYYSAAGAAAGARPVRRREFLTGPPRRVGESGLDASVAGLVQRSGEK